MVKNGFTRAYATSLRRIIAVNTGNRFKAFLSGLGVTAVLQSSTATALVAASFAEKGMIGTAAGLAVMIGADISTTLVAQILTFDLSWLMPCLILSGVVINHFFEHVGRERHLARALIGLGLILLSLSIIKQNALHLENSSVLPILLQPLEREPLLALIVAALMTWLLHSSLAAVLIIASLAASDTVNLHLGMLLVLGANLGGALVPFIITLKMPPEARRITVGNLLMRITTVLLMVPLTNEFAQFLVKEGTEYSREIVHFHTFFNVALAVLFMPLITPLEKLCMTIVPDEKKERKKTDTPQYLDPNALDSPTIALAGAARETLRIAEIVEKMFEDSMIALKKEDSALIESIRKRDKTVDSLHDQIKLYLSRVSEEMLDPRESDRFLQILSYSTNLEYIGDIIENSLLEITETKINSRHRFSTAGFQEIQNFHKTILENMKMAQTIFISEDPKLARQLVEGKKTIREAEWQSSVQHFKRLREGLPETISTSALHTDIIRDYRRINSYVTTVAYSILNNPGKKSSRRKEANH
ncbi:MAG: Na/Pi cotransporter family protein [Alphaproteobacteria bacterium]|nr:Na/Pi cotransporter family protein [Alphaproteobacteria bacterium]